MAVTPESSAGDLSGIFGRVRDGDTEARRELLGKLYQRLQRLTAVLLGDFPAVQRRRQIDSVANDLAIRLIAALDAGLRTATTADFFRLAGFKLRQMLIDEARKLAGPRGKVRSLTGDGSDGGDIDPPGWSLDPTVLAEWTEFHQEVEKLPADQKAVFDLHFFLQMPQAEIARVMALEAKQVSRLWLGACLKLSDYVPSLG